MDRAARFCDLMAPHGRVVLFGAAAQRKQAMALQALARTPPLDLVGRTSMLEYAALIKRMDIVATSDSSASHLAATFGRPAVVLFGPTFTSDWRPASDSVRLLSGAGGWNPEKCHAEKSVVRYCSDCRFERVRCMDFSAEEVAAAMADLAGGPLQAGVDGDSTDGR